MEGKFNKYVMRLHLLTFQLVSTVLLQHQRILTFSVGSFLTEVWDVCKNLSSLSDSCDFRSSEICEFVSLFNDSCERLSESGDCCCRLPSGSALPACVPISSSAIHTRRNTDIFSKTVC